MNNPLLNAEAARWNRVGRRWAIILAVLLTVNLSLVVVAFSGYGQSSTESVANDVGVEPAAQPAGLSVAACEPGLDDCPLAVEQEGENSGPAAPPCLANVATCDPRAARPLEAGSQKSPEAASEGIGPAAGEGEAELVIVNPSVTGGMVHFLLDGTAVSLEPGEYVRSAGANARGLVFHRGDAFENSELTLETGVFAFSVSPTGWQLEPAATTCEELAKTCRPIGGN